MVALSGEPEPDRVELAKICSRVENDWVGAQTGLLDQLSSLLGEADRALRIDFRSLDVQPVALELGGYSLVTLDSGDRHTHAGSGYNERREECAAASEALGVPSLREATLEAAEQLPEPLNRRARHVITENERVDARGRRARAPRHGRAGSTARRLAREPARRLPDLDPAPSRPRMSGCTTPAR